VPEPRLTRDGSFSLFSTEYGEGFHSADGALTEARTKFITPAELHRFPPGHELVVVEVAMGTGTNTACLLEAVAAGGLGLRWWGLELDPVPLALALGDSRFRRQWPQPVLERLEALRGSEGMLWGDARQRLAVPLAEAAGRCDLVLLDAFSPRRCPQLWSVEFLSSLARLLNPEGRLLTYSAAAAARRGMQLASLELAAIRAWESGGHGRPWCLGTVASTGPLPPSRWLRPLEAMELEHLATRAAEPYRDPCGAATAAEILAARARAQAASGAGSGSAWRRRWAIGHAGPPTNSPRPAPPLGDAAQHR
jgi:tRNA U34 5-methylaminomethyl-2-thiouridine-forming methyltransferase MnmC